MRSLRFRLLALWVMLVVSGAATAYLLYESFRQTSNVRVARAEDMVNLACRNISDRYQFLVSGWKDAAIDQRFKGELATILEASLAHALGVEGGFWQAEQGSLAYAFPSYEGTGPKTDLPTAELNTIRQVNAEALRAGRSAIARQSGRSQTLLVYACPMPGPLGVTAWTMTRVFTAGGPAYNQLLIGLLVLALTIFGSAIWLARILYSWSRKIAGLEHALNSRKHGSADLPTLAHTGTPELDRLVDALNVTGERLALARRRAGAAERLAAVGRLAADLAHEIRNPIAAMRLKSENALASPDGARKDAALKAILQQIARLDGLLRDLLEMTQAREPQFAETDLISFLQSSIESHRELAASKGVSLNFEGSDIPSPSPRFDASQMQRALDNLILNAIQNTPKGGRVTVDALRRYDCLLLRVSDSGPGVSEELKSRLFEPFVTGRADGTGLGLAIVREIARLHGGDARLAHSGAGAIFEIEVPWQPS